MTTPTNIPGAADLLAGFVPGDQLAGALGKSERTIDRLVNQPDGLPYVKVGRTRLFNIDSVRDWLIARETQRNPKDAPRRGRPRKAA